MFAFVYQFYKHCIIKLYTYWTVIWFENNLYEFPYELQICVLYYYTDGVYDVYYCIKNHSN